VKNKIYKPRINVGAVNRKAMKAALDTGFVGGILGAVFGMFASASNGHGYNSALLGAMIIGPLAGIAFGLLRAAFVWGDILIRFRGNLAFNLDNTAS